MLNWLFVGGGLVLLIFSANWLVNGASSVAKRWGLPDMVIGLTIVAFGTSAPELTVNMMSALQGSTDIAIGTVLGSNISNILLILGVSSIIYPLTIKLNTKWKEIPFSLLAAIILGILANDMLYSAYDDVVVVSRRDGLVLLVFFLAFMLYTFRLAKVSPEDPDTINLFPIWKSVLFIIVGLAGLYLGGKYLVDGAVGIAQDFGLSEKVIGLTVIAIGTSLPELATCVVAAMKKRTDIAVGNVVGSNIFNIFLILGLTATVQPLPFDASTNFDIYVVIGASFLLFLTTVVFGINKIVRAEGILFLALYIAYITYSLLN
jgi:cation:H+ antiporter